MREAERRGGIEVRKKRWWEREVSKEAKGRGKSIRVGKYEIMSDRQNPLDSVYIYICRS